ncbi:hypothetical protein [Kaarinaea lacus]
MRWVFLTTPKVDVDIALGSCTVAAIQWLLRRHLALNNVSVAGINDKLDAEVASK